MSLYVPEGTPPLIPQAMARIIRRLPRAGEILVNEGSRVEPEDVIGKAFVPADPQIINVAQVLAIPPATVGEAMRYQAGDRVERGAILARGGVFGARSCKAPSSGIITAIDAETGYVVLSPDPLEVTMTANIRGVVMEIIPHEGVIIETLAAQVYGIVGCGGERHGVLQLLVTDPDQLVTDDQIDARNAYTILIGGAGITAAALKKAVQVQVRGIIVGGIEEQEWRAFLGWSTPAAWRTGATTWEIPHPQDDQRVGLTLMVTEGFGIHPMATPTFTLLSSRVGQEALIDGRTVLRNPMRRPRLVISLARSSGGALEVPPPVLRPGATVRVLDPHYLGYVAKVRSVPSYPIQLPSGVRTMGVEVVLETEESSFWLPRTAVEVLN